MSCEIFFYRHIYLYAYSQKNIDAILMTEILREHLRETEILREHLREKTDVTESNTCFKRKLQIEKVNSFIFPFPVNKKDKT